MAESTVSAGLIPEPAPEDPKRPYAVGTLRYSLSGVIVVSAWVILGGNIFGMLGSLVPTLLPLTLERFGASGALIGLVVGSIPAAMNFVMNPILSTASDRTRTRWGRRIPYLVFATPFVTLFLILIGWITPITGYVHAHFFPGMEIGTLGIALVCVFSVVFQFFNLIVGSIYYYIFADVIPHQFIGRFMAVFNLTGSLVGFLFPRYLLPLGERHVNWLFTGVALFYLVTIVFMCRAVREGSYPADRSGESFSPAGMVRSYFRECYSIPFYYSFFIMMALSDVSTVCRMMF